MLVLSRKPSQRVVIVHPPTRLSLAVSVLSVSGKRVRLGFHAPDGVRILREEIAGMSCVGPVLGGLAADGG